MALHVNNRDIVEIFANNRVISTIYKGGRIVWEAIRSCFGSGMWISAKAWLYNEGWKNSKKH